ncbi:MAG: hypothetical protein K9N35_02595 [Candidatus Marinimicrobia bacterium]|nr:hypothetical protein [Candidatus Neomarinimicrobiota bacterium]
MLKIDFPGMKLSRSLVLCSAILCQHCDAPGSESTNILLAPSTLRVEAISASEIQLFWTDNSDNERGFFIERKAGESFIQKYQVAENITEFVDDKVSADSTYSYRVFAYATLKKSAHSNVGTTSTYTVTDIDGNEYATVQIGEQKWMVENLRTTHFRNSEPVPHLVDLEAWTSTTSAAFCYFNNDSSTGEDYGLIYNWMAATDERGIAPEGWHVPTYADWDILFTFLGGESEAGIKLFSGPHPGLNSDRDNISGFNAQDGVSRSDPYGYSIQSNFCNYWTTSPINETYAYFAGIFYEYATVNLENPKQRGIPIRCVKD